MNLKKIISRFGLLLFITIVSSCAQQLNNTPLSSQVIPTTPIITTIATKTATSTVIGNIDQSSDLGNQMSNFYYAMQNYVIGGAR